MIGKYPLNPLLGQHIFFLLALNFLLWNIYIYGRFFQTAPFCH
jgi:hypothetical protein